MAMKRQINVPANAKKVGNESAKSSAALYQKASETKK